MTQNNAQNTATRQRMAGIGEPYSVARYAVEHTHGSAADPEFKAQEQAAEARPLAHQATCCDARCPE